MEREDLTIDDVKTRNNGSSIMSDGCWVSLKYRIFRSRRDLCSAPLVRIGLRISVQLKLRTVDSIAINAETGEDVDGNYSGRGNLAPTNRLRDLYGNAIDHGNG